MAFVAYRVSKARLPKCHDRLSSRLIIAGLTVAQPVLRGWTRYKTLVNLRRHPAASACPLPLGEAAVCDEQALPRIGFFRRLGATAGILSHHLAFHRFFWNNKGLEREALLASIIGVLHTLGVRHTLDSGFSTATATPPWDISIKAGRLTTARMRVTVENHGGEKRFVRLAGSVLPTGMAVVAFLALVGTALGAALIHPMTALVAAGTAVLLAGGMTVGLFRAASMVAMLTQYVMVTRPGCSLTEPSTAKAVRAARERQVAPTDTTPAFAAEAAAPAVKAEPKEDVLAA